MLILYKENKRMNDKKFIITLEFKNIKSIYRETIVFDLLKSVLFAYLLKIQKF